MAQHEMRAQIVVSGKEDGSLTQLGNKLQGMAMQIQGISNAAMDFMKESVDTYRNYEDGILETRSVLQSTYTSVNSLERDMQNIEKAAQHWAETTIFTTDDVANSIANAAHAGWDYNKIIEGMPSAMLIAQAGHLELADGVDYLTKMMAATGTAFEDSEGFVNEWAKAADLAATDIDEIGQAFLKLGTASRLAETNEELFAFMSVLAESGTTGAVAGTAIRNVMARIAAPTNKAEEAMLALGLSEEEAADALSELDETSTEAYQRLTEMGFSAYDTEGKLRPFKDIITDMNIMLGDMDEKSRNDFLKQLFGTKSFAYAMTLLDAANDGSLTSIYEAILGVRDTDYAEQKSQTVMSGLTGAVEIMNSKWQEFHRKVGETFSNPMKWGINILDGFIDGLNDMSPVALSGLTGAISTIAVSAPALMTAGIAAKMIGSLGIASALPWVGTAAAIVAATAAFNEFVDSRYEGQFGSMNLETDPLNQYLKGLDTTFSNLATNANTWRESMSTALEQYTTASVSLSSDLLTSMITGTTLTDDDITNLTDLGASMHDALVSGIENGTAESMSWFEALFSYGEKNPNDNAAYNDLILAYNTQYNTALVEAQKLGKSLGSAISDAVKDGIISGDEYQTISELMQKYNEAMEMYSNAERAGELNQMLQSAQSVSWDSYADWASETTNNYKNKVAELDSQYWYEYGKAESLYRSLIDKGEINPTTGKAYTEDDWLSVSQAMQTQYNSAKGDYTSGYEQAIMNATQAVLMSGGMWDAFEFLRGFNGVLTNDQLNQLQNQEGLLDSMTAFNESFARISGLISPFMAGMGIDVNAWKEWIPMLIEAGNTNGTGNTDVDEQYEAERRFMTGEGLETPGDTDIKPLSDLAFFANGMIQNEIDSFRDLVSYIGDPARGFREVLDSSFASEKDAANDVSHYVGSFLSNLFGGSAHADEYSRSDIAGFSRVTDNGSGQALKSQTESLFGSEITQDISVTDNGAASSLRSSIESQFSSPITQQVNVQKTGGGFLSAFAEGGRATEASIFGEAGAEWAIPEQHSERTAELLTKAAAASGFTWGELLTRNGGLNAGSSGSTTIVYSPTINAGGSDGVEKALINDKARFDKFLRERNMINASTAYA